MVDDVVASVGEKKVFWRDEAEKRVDMKAF
jgi:hypothetical protein